jgi:8-hydroxy-5-deazaflavin:NADPH oxidoreductase
MTTLKTIAIIGSTGNMGAAVASRLAKGRYRLLLMSDDATKLTTLKRKLENFGALAEIDTISCSKEACWEADIIVIASPYEDEKKVADKIRDVAVGKIVISITNPISKSYHELIHSNTSAAEELQKMLPYSKVVKTLNTKLASEFISIVADGKQPDTFIAGNNGEAVSEVSELVRSAGLNPLVVGDLTLSRSLERIQFILLQRRMQTSVLNGLRSTNK